MRWPPQYKLVFRPTGPPVRAYRTVLSLWRRDQRSRRSRLEGVVELPNNLPLWRDLENPAFVGFGDENVAVLEDLDA